MSIQSQIDRLNSAKSSLKSAISSKGVSVPSDASIEDLPALVRSIPQEGGSSSGSGIIDVAELPTSNIDENAVYRLTENIQLEKTEVYFRAYINGMVTTFTLQQYLASLGVPTIPNIYVVDDLSNMLESDAQTFSVVNAYILRSDGIAYAYVPAYGGIITYGLFGFQATGYDRGFTENITAETESGVYTTIENIKEVVRYFIRENGEWKEVTTHINSTLPNGFTDINVLSGEYVKGEEIVITQNGTSLDVADKIIKDKSIPTAIIVNTPNTAELLEGVSEDGTRMVITDEYFRKKNGEYIDNIRAGAFYGCFLDDIVIPEAIWEIGEYAFSRCNAYTVVLPNNLTVISYGMFESSNIDNIRLPERLKIIDKYAFDHSRFKGQLPDSVERIEDYAFGGCLFSSISLPKSLSYIGGWAFQQCWSLRTVTFNSKPEFYYNNYIFGDCNNLTTINVPWSEGEVDGAPWGAPNATINYNYTEG